MMFKYLNVALVSLALTVSNFSAHAGIIDSSSILLDDAGATQLENWYGQGDLDWDSIWYGTTGATSASWHAAVDGLTETFSIYNVTYDNSTYLIGGYNSGDWASPGYQHGLSTNFIFNLTNNIMHDTTHGYWGLGQFATYSDASSFAVFGGAYDMSGGWNAIGANFGSSRSFGTYNGVYGASAKGNIVDFGLYDVSYRVNALETFTVAPSKSVPEPSTLAIFALGMIGLASSRFKKQS
jgi:hypothetical protein